MTPLAPALLVAALLSLASPLPTAAAESAPEGTLARRAPDTLLASRLGAVEVVTPGGETLGDVSDVILSRDGRVVALVVGVGGFLGLAEKPVAIAYEHLTVRPTEDGIELVSELDRAALEAAPPYEERDE